MKIKQVNMWGISEIFVSNCIPECEFRDFVMQPSSFTELKERELSSQIKLEKFKSCPSNLQETVNYYIPFST